MYSVGAFARRRYVEEAGLLSRNWDPVRFSSTRRASRYTSERIGDGPRNVSRAGGYSSMPEPVPVSLNGTKGHDNLGKKRAKRGAPRGLRDTALWDAGPGRAFERKGLLDRLSAMCGSDLRRALEVSGGVEGKMTLVKTFPTPMMFPVREAFASHSLQSFYGAVRAAALEQLYTDGSYPDAQRVYMAGDFPQAMVAHFQSSVARTNNATSAPR